jgi:hypothetical protein
MQNKHLRWLAPDGAMKQSSSPIVGFSTTEQQTAQAGSEWHNSGETAASYDRDRNLSSAIDAKDMKTIRERTKAKGRDEGSGCVTLDSIF